MTHRLRRFYARMPLRLRLVGVLLVLVVVALVGSGFAATATMRSYLVGRVDEQLSSAVDHEKGSLTGTGRDGGPGGGGGGGGPDDADNGHRQQTPFVVEARNATGTVVYQSSSRDLINAGPLPLLPKVTGAQAAREGTRRFTVDSVSGDQRWRVISLPVTLADGSTDVLFVAQSLGDMQDTLNRLTGLLVVIGAVAVVVVVGIGYVVVRRSLRPLAAVERTAAAIAAGDLSQRVPSIDPRTEVGQLSSALNTMLAEIELAFAERAASEGAARDAADRLTRSEAAARRSEERMRRFVADASHELRTPLTTIRGFAELYRQGAAGNPDDVARLLRRIEDEAARMGLLVDDLLLLARMDQERPLAQKPVDLLALANDAVQAARVVDPERPIRLEVGITDPPPIVTGDEPRLRQVLGNLVTNALRHTPPGTPITVGVGTEGGDRVTVVVADEGPGMRPEDAEHAFERFYRADAARSRADGGTGLGLAIAHALVVGHGGSITVDTAPGLGATFRITLPLAR